MHLGGVGGGGSCIRGRGGSASRGFCIGGGGLHPREGSASRSVGVGETPPGLSTGGLGIPRPRTDKHPKLCLRSVNIFITNSHPRNQYITVLKCAYLSCIINPTSLQNSFPAFTYFRSSSNPVKPYKYNQRWILYPTWRLVVSCIGQFHCSALRNHIHSPLNTWYYGPWFVRPSVHVCWR